ncbi:MAG: DUF3473 domain-containing protein, partial [Planctomycetaceae bacterium]|nr:DUF3473 domain-containing protein [Planctomycetaceae bacterium]
AFGRIISKNDWPNYESRSVANTERLLGIFEKHHVQATFFVLGYEAKRNPNLVRKIAAAGHEIGSHGMEHQLVYTQDREKFRCDVGDSRKLLQDLSGQEILAYRAPTFSIGRQTPWGHTVLAETGYRYDSSVFPIHHDLYGNPDAPVTIHKIETEAGPILEFPMTVVKFAGMNIPVGGGGYFRLFPLGVTLYFLNRVNRERPFVFYLHPWEVDPEQPRIAGAPFKSRFRHYLNLRKTASRLECLLERFSFAPLGRILQEWRDIHEDQ